MQIQPYLDSFDRARVLVVANDELAAEREPTMRRVFEFCGVDPGFGSEQFERQWETGSGKQAGGFRLMDRAVRLPGLRALDRNFDRLPESLRWIVERVVHDPGRGAAPKPELPDQLRQRLEDLAARRRPRARGDHRAQLRLALTAPQAPERSRISVNTAVRPDSSSGRCSSAITWATALISARWVNA